MPIEVEHEAPEEGGEYEPGQQAFEALGATLVDADEVTLMGLFAALQRGAEWAELPPAQRKLCLALERELFEEGEGGA